MIIGPINKDKSKNLVYITDEYEANTSVYSWEVAGEYRIYFNPPRDGRLMLTALDGLYIKFVGVDDLF